MIWNRTRSHEAAAQTYERAGARVLVAENGYLDRLDGSKTYALALGKHNGAGRWFVGDQPRREIADEPWGPRGDHVLVLPQRGIGERGVAMPSGWPLAIRDRLAAITKRPLIFRRHPGHRVDLPLEPDFARAHCVVTWASGAGVKAIRAGVPCFYEMDKWIAGCAAARLADQIERCDTPDRGMLWRLVSWAQWTLAEIETGEAFDRLLHEDDSRLFRAR